MNNKRNMYLSEYCVGCGLCQSIGISQLHEDSKGFVHPHCYDPGILNKICPVNGIHNSFMDSHKIWGRNEAVYLGWSKNKNIRDVASSGGVLTELASYLLETSMVDVIVQVGADPMNPTKTKLFYNTTREGVLSCSGSRYSISHPLIEIKNIELQKKYAFIGKPCDVVVLRNYMELYSELKNVIVYSFSFFCMGIPSFQAQNKLLKTLGCDEKECCKLQYRGNGWPGYTIAVDDTGKEYSLDYNSSWGNILGRDLMPACKFCIDGLGELADISCGDAWYLDKNNHPDFSEHDGRNVIFARTIKGKELLEKMQKAELLEIDEYENYESQLKLIQKSQYERRIDMRARIMALKVMNKPVPRYSNKLLKQYSKECSFERQMNIFIGTCKRIVRGNI